MEIQNEVLFLSIKQCMNVDLSIKVLYQFLTSYLYYVNLLEVPLV